MPWVGLQYVIVVFPDHTHFLAVEQRVHDLPICNPDGGQLKAAAKRSLNFRLVGHHYLAYLFEQPFVIGKPLNEYFCKQ